MKDERKRGAGKEHADQREKGGMHIGIKYNGQQGEEHFASDLWEDQGDTGKKPGSLRYFGLTGI